jgi:hypothetical protein
MDSAKVGTPPRAGFLTKVRNNMEASNSRTGSDIMDTKNKKDAGNSRDASNSRAASNSWETQAAVGTSIT